MEDFRESRDLLSSFHLSGIFYEFPVVPVTEIFEQNQDSQQVLSEEVPGKFTKVLRCVDFAIEMAAHMNLVFCFAGFFLVAFLFDHTSKRRCSS